ncbi:MAG: winged helix DNA-binding protein [Schumannella sp.]|nr:winged helix DNA-binding protein [Schumannella sp.]
MTEGRLASLRLSALGIARAHAPNPLAAVHGLLAMQAQDYAGALWSVGLRVPGSTVTTVEEALASGQIVRSWPMRGTLHLVAADDLGWMLGLTGQRMVRAAEGRRRSLGLGAADFVRAEELLRAELSGGRTASRAELFAALDAGGISPAGQRGVHTLGQLAQTGVLVQSTKDNWRLLEEWVPQPRRLEPDEALREFALRYALGHGPVTARDFAWWSSLTLTDARAGLAAAADELATLSVDDETYYLRPGLEPAPPALHLLPGFDEFVLGYTDRTAQLPKEQFLTIVPGGNGVFLPTIVVDGQIVGTWKRAKSTSKRITFALSPFAALTAPTLRAVETRLTAYGEFLGTEVALA